MEPVTTYRCSADAFHCDFQHQYCMSDMGNALLNAADIHSTQRKFGMLYLNTLNKTWVLSRLAIELESMPTEHEDFNVNTWVENAMKYFTKRNWEIVSDDGKKVYGYAKSIWAMIDLTTREPQDIFQVNEGTITEYIHKDKECPIADVSRVKTPEMTDYTEFQVKYSDIDVNGHCNSMKYIDHVLDTFSLDFFRQNMVHRMEIAYVAESYCGDTIRIYNQLAEDGSYYFRLAKQTEDSEIELCRLKITTKAV